MTALDAGAARRASPQVDARAYRLSDIDMLRGLVIRLFGVAVGMAQGFKASQLAVIGAFLPDGFGVSLPLVYVVWVVVLVTLYPLCTWMADVKSRRRDWWLSYV